MAHPPPQYNAQQQLGMTNVSLQQMLGQRAMNVSGGMPIHQQQNVGASGATAAPPERTIIDDLEATFQGCIAPLLPGTDNASKLNVSTDKLRSSMELSIKEFTEQAQKVEAYFVKKHAMVALQQPELIIQEEIEELKEEITRRDKTLKNHAAKVNSWLESIRTLQKAINETPSTEPIQMNPATSATQPHPESIQQQMMNQRR